VYDHVVIDEAQDVAPLYLAALRPLSRNNSFTLLGDLAQGVHAYRGLADWDEARQALAGRQGTGVPYQFADVRESYRSTVEIMQFANRLLELIAPPGRPGQPVRLALPFNRHGPPVGVHVVPTAEALGPALAARLAALAQAGHHNLAVIARTPEHAAEVAQALGAAGVAGALLAAQAGAAYAGGVVVLPVYLAKGLEFDAVVVAGADDTHYSGGEFDGRLLYVAATRALHALEFVCVGAPNVFVELAR
jgi:DNA helicase-2/ATP-dependent DNA helicase PcrA